jgi:hemopexin
MANVRNKRMINSVSVGIVYVGGPGEYSISNAEKTHILAKITSGLEDLANNEPDAKITCNYSTLSANLNNFVPWDGANWPGLKKSFYKGIDTALMNKSSNKIYFFKGSEYYRINPANGWQPDAGYPKPISGNWPGLDAGFTSNIDAAFWSETNNKVYMFKGSNYVRIDPSNGWQMDASYPKPIAGNWSGFPAEFAAGVDAALFSKSNNRIYFFKGTEYIRVNPAAGWVVEAGYPKLIVDHWPGIPNSYIDPSVPYQGGAGIDAALWCDVNNKIYLFKKATFWAGTYVRIDPAAGWAVENGYPKPIGLSVGGTEALWRDKAQTQLGYPTGYCGVEQLCDALQGGNNSQSGYVTYFTKFPTMHMGYASGIKVVMHRTPPGLFTDWSSIDNVMAHETGHMFGAPDEYSGSKCGCDDMRGKFIKAPNGNCAYESCADSPTNCLMKNNTPSQLCPFTPFHIGWGAFLTNIDAALYSFKNNKIYMFSKGYYIRYTSDFKFEDNYPKPIKGNWPGFPADFAEGVDAGFYAKANNKIYYFKGSEYIRVNPNNGWQVDAGYPKNIAGNWSGFPASFAGGVDAALWSEANNRIYFFKGNQYIKVNPSAGWAVQPGYPKNISGNWPGFPATFNAGIDSALWSEHNNRIYFFKGLQYIRVNPAAGWAVEAGYPKNINKNWRMPFPK